MTTVRGITSSVDIVWSSDGIEIVRREGVTINTTTDSPTVYTDYYTISQLKTTDDDSVYQCEVVINRSLQISATSNVTLDIIGKYSKYISPK